MVVDSSALKAAFQRFVELIEPIEDVYYAEAIEPRRPDIYTYIKQLDREVFRQIFRAEDVIDDEFPDLLIEFHTVILDGRSIEEFTKPKTELFYARPGMNRKERTSGDER